jgi:hypothetical protein
MKQYRVRFVNLERAADADVVDKSQLTLAVVGEPDEMDDVWHDVLEGQLLFP